MADVVNKWNINMNTLSMADVEVEKAVTVYGFALRETGGTICHIFWDENECVVAWYNAHCAASCEISAIDSKQVQKNEFLQTQLEAFRQTLLAKPLKRVIPMPLDYPQDEVFVRESLIWNECVSGSAQDQLSMDAVYHYGYGLLYWQNNEAQAFFDNRLAKAYEKLMRLQEAHIYPLWIRIKKQHEGPIVVREGRKLVHEIGERSETHAFYDYMNGLRR